MYTHSKYNKHRPPPDAIVLQRTPNNVTPKHHDYQHTTHYTPWPEGTDPFDAFLLFLLFLLSPGWHVPLSHLSPPQPSSHLHAPVPSNVPDPSQVPWPEQISPSPPCGHDMQLGPKYLVKSV